VGILNVDQGISNFEVKYFSFSAKNNILSYENRFYSSKYRYI